MPLSYLIPKPGIRQRIGKNIYTIVRMFSDERDAQRFADTLGGSYESVRIYLRKKEGKPFGRHPWCVAVRGRKR